MKNNLPYKTGGRVKNVLKKTMKHIKQICSSMKQYTKYLTFAIVFTTFGWFMGQAGNEVYQFNTERWDNCLSRLYNASNQYEERASWVGTDREKQCLKNGTPITYRSAREYFLK